MKTHPFKEQSGILKQLYAKSLATHGDSPQAVQWSDRETQERRLDILAQVADLSSAKILDFGCGTGHLLSFLLERYHFNGEYVGYDLSNEMVQVAQSKFPSVRIEQRDVLCDGIVEDFDYVFISGVFNNKLKDNWEITTAILRCLFAKTRKALAFNGLSTYVDYFDCELFYMDPDKVFHFCKEELSPCVTLRHDYLLKPDIVPYEFTMYILKTSVAPLSNAQTQPAIASATI